MFKNGLPTTIAALAIGASSLIAGSAHAHIAMYGPLMDRGGNQKAKPCGGANRGSRVYTFEPGATIQIGVTESIPHDGYFRISFDDDGTDGFKDPVSIAPLNPNRAAPGKKCLDDRTDGCGKSDFCSLTSASGGPTVLWDNLDPHLGSASKRNYTWNITLPNVECSNCTLQVMQVMEDIAGGFHGPFDGRSDLYYRCVDIVLKKGAGKTPGTVSTAPTTPKGIDCVKQAAQSHAGVAAPPSGEGDASADPRAFVLGDDPAAAVSVPEEEVLDDGAGCSISPTASSGAGFGQAAFVLALGALWRRGRRRRTRED